MSDDLQNRLTVASLTGTLAFGRLALAMLFAGNALVYAVTRGADGFTGLVLAIAAAAGSYVAQLLYTLQAERAGLIAHAVVLIAAIGSFISMGR